MANPLNRVADALQLRDGEGSTLAVLAAFLFLNTANTTLLSAAKNGLFLSVYPGELIPHAIIAAALLTAVTAIVFTGVIAGTARRSLALWLTVGLTASIVICRILFYLDPRTSFVIYLWISAVQVLVITHAWDYVSDLLTGRQAKRLLPLIGMGASIGAIMGGASIAPAAFRYGTDTLLLFSAALLVLALPLLWAVPEPATEDDDEETMDMGAVRAFVSGAARGFKALRRERLLRLLALGIVALTLTGTLIDLQLKLVLQESFTRDRITAIYGLMSAAVGTGTLLLQLWASRVIFPKLGVSFAAMLQGGALTVASGGVAVSGGVFALAALQSLDDILQHSLQKPVEQISLLPFPGKIKNAAVATLGGVLRPLSKAAAGGVALALAAQSNALPVITVISAALAFLVYTRHRRTYMGSLEAALARHSVELGDVSSTPLQFGREALDVIDRALTDQDPTVVVFAASLLEQLPLSDAAPRASGLLNHAVPEVRAEAAGVLSRMDHGYDDFAAVAVTERLRVEEDPLVLTALLTAAGLVPGIDPVVVEPYREHETSPVRRSGLVALGRLGVPVEKELRALMAGGDSEARIVAAGAVGDLGLTELLPDLSQALEDQAARPAVLDALSSLGKPAVPTMSALLARRDLPLPTRRSVVTALAAVEGREARDALLELANEPVLGPAAMTSLLRMRTADRIDPVEPAQLRDILGREVETGLRYALASVGILGKQRPDDDVKRRFVAEELNGLSYRSLHRVMRALSLSYDASRLSAVAGALASDDAAQKSNALELLEGSISANTAATVMPFVEAAAEGFPESRVVSLLPNAVDLLQQPAEALLDEDDWWPRAMGLHLLGRDEEISTPGLSKVERHEDEAPNMIPLIEKVMILKGSQLFRNFPGAELAGIAALATVVHLDEGEVLFEQGEEGDAFYMVVRGKMRITRGAAELALLGPREGFGEMAILDRETRSATATAAERTTLLRIDQDSFDQLIEQNPAVARGIYRVLTERLRSTLAQVAAG